MRNPNDEAVDERSEASADYPLGGAIEPYDIAREKEMTDQE